MLDRHANLQQTVCKCNCPCRRYSGRITSSDILCCDSRVCKERGRDVDGMKASGHVGRADSYYKQEGEEVAVLRSSDWVVHLIMCSHKTLVWATCRPTLRNQTNPVETQQWEQWESDAVGYVTLSSQCFVWIFQIEIISPSLESISL